MPPFAGPIPLPSPEATDALAARLAPDLRAGDTILLDGPIGAGKTHFARALIHARLGPDEEVPSPTFTLVQTYGTGADEIWHADLYRLGGPDEALELGLVDAFDTAICLVEWPDRLGELRPDGALTLRFAARAGGHDVSASGPRAWADRMEAALA